MHFSVAALPADAPVTITLVARHGESSDIAPHQASTAREPILAIEIFLARLHRANWSRRRVLDERNGWNAHWLDICARNLGCHIADGVAHFMGCVASGPRCLTSRSILTRASASLFRLRR